MHLKFSRPFSHILFGYVYLFVGLNLFVLISLALNYPENYFVSFWDYYVSDLGAHTTPQGYENYTNQFWFTLLLLFNAGLSLFFGYLTERESLYEDQFLLKKVKALSLFCLSIGFILASFPIRYNEIMDLLHGIGALFVYFSFFVLISCILLEHIMCYILPTSQKIGFALYFVCLMLFLTYYLFFSSPEVAPRFQKYYFALIFLFMLLFPILVRGNQAILKNPFIDEQTCIEKYGGVFEDNRCILFRKKKKDPIL